MQSEEKSSSLSAKMLALSGSWSCLPFPTFSFSTNLKGLFLKYVGNRGEKKAGGLHLSSDVIRF